MRPEFLNRVDDIVMFKPLTLWQIEMIVELQIKNLKTVLHGSGINLVAKENAVRWIADHGFDPQLGARPIKRLIQKEIVNQLSKEIISGKLSKDNTIVLDAEKGYITFSQLNADKL